MRKGRLDTQSNSFGVTAGSCDPAEMNPCFGLSAQGQENQRARVLTEGESKSKWEAFDAEDYLIALTFKLRLLTAALNFLRS